MTASAPVARFGTAALALLALSPGSNAFWSRSRPNVDHRSIALADGDTRPTVVQNVLDQLDHVDRQTSCQRTAMKGLLDACEHSDPLLYRGTDSLAHEVVEDYQKLFAIRLTHCELADAQVDLPVTCKSLLEKTPSPQHLHQRVLDCLPKLERHSDNAWTTYENKRGETSILCRAIRAEHDKDEAINFFRFLATLFGDLGSAVIGIEDNLSNVAGVFDRLRKAVVQYHQDLQVDFQDQRSAMKEGMHELTECLKSTRDELINLGREAHDGLAALRQQAKDMEDASTLASTLVTNVDMYGTRVGLINAELENLPARFVSNAEHVIGQFTDKVVAITNSVELAKDASAQLSAQVDQINDQLATGVGMVGMINAGMGDALSKQEDLMTQFAEVSADINQTRESVDKLNKAAGKLASLSDIINRVFTWFSLSSLSGSGLKLYFLFTTATLGAVYWFQPFWIALLAACISITALSLITTLLAQSGPTLRRFALSTTFDDYLYMVLLSGAWAGSLLAAYLWGRSTNKPTAQPKEHDLEELEYY